MMSASTVISENKVKPAPETPCAHCDLSIGDWPAGGDPYFCCTGCEVVYGALSEAGYLDTYYKLQNIGESGEGAQPANSASNPSEKQALLSLDSQDYLEKHTENSNSIQDGRHTTLFVDGVHCAACVWLVEQMPSAVEGVHHTRLDLTRGQLQIDWNPDEVKLSEVGNWLHQFGYSLHPSRKSGLDTKDSAERKLLLKMGITWGLAGNIMLLAVSLYAGLDDLEDTTFRTAGRWLSLILAIPAIWYGGSEFFRRAWAALKLSIKQGSFKTLHMDTPISIGILAGFAQSTWSTITNSGTIWFDSLTVLIAALLTARWLQLRSQRLAGDATERLLSLIPSMGRVILGDGSTEMIETKSLSAGVQLQVLAGEVFPADGFIISGQTQVNNAVITGESLPESAGEGHKVQAGATNLQATVVIEITATADQTRVGSLLTWIRENAGQSRPLPSLADKISGYFVLTVLALAGLTAIIWIQLDPNQWVQNVVALLVITCPCALSMATPLAMAIAGGRATRKGIFVKTEEAFYNLTKINRVVLDKTGTLTQGKMRIVNFAGDKSILPFVAALETHSNHPIAQAFLVDFEGASQHFSVSNVVVAPIGITGHIDDNIVVAGNMNWITSRITSEIPINLQQAHKRFADEGLTPIVLATNNQVVAIAALDDALREDAQSLIQALQSAGQKITLLSGDHPKVALRIGKLLGLKPENIRGGVSPEGKKLAIEAFQSAGETVAMLGDGVNDAAALQQADVGMAYGKSTSASIVAADLFITADGLSPVVSLFSSANQIFTVIKRNLTFSLVYNVIGATAAMAGLITPLVAAIAMPISSLVVILTSVFQGTFTNPFNGTKS